MTPARAPCSGPTARPRPPEPPAPRPPGQGWDGAVTAAGRRGSPAVLSASESRTQSGPVGPGRACTVVRGQTQQSPQKPPQGPRCQAQSMGSLWPKFRSHLGSAGLSEPLAQRPRAHVSINSTGGGGGTALPAAPLALGAQAPGTTSHLSCLHPASQSGHGDEGRAEWVSSHVYGPPAPREEVLAPLYLGKLRLQGEVTAQ